MNSGIRALSSVSLRRFGGLFSAVCCVAVVVAGCGSEVVETQSKTLSESQRTYGMMYDIPLYCGGNSAAQTLDLVIESARRLSAFCEMQNIETAKGGYLRCPTGLCQQEYSPGAKAAPTMKFTVSNGSSMSSMFGGYGGSGGGSGGSSDSVFGSRIYVTLEFNIPLARTPDVLACVNPLSASVQSSILNEIGKAALAPKTGPCIPQNK
jgi:hypothetical protein